MDGSPGHLVAGFAVIAAMTLPIYSILAAHSNDQLSAGQIVAASGTMAFLMQLRQVGGIFIGPNVVPLPAGIGGGDRDGRGGDGRHTALAYRGPDVTAEFVPIGVIGMAQPGMLQAEVMAEEKEDSS